MPSHRVVSLSCLIVVALHDPTHIYHLDRAIYMVGLFLQYYYNAIQAHSQSGQSTTRRYI